MNEIQKVLNRVIENPVRRAGPAGRGAPGLRHEVPPCSLSDQDKATLAVAVKLWLTVVDFACELALSLSQTDRRPELVAKAIREIDLTLAAVPEGEASRKLRALRGSVARVPALPEAQMKQGIAALNGWLDAIEPLRPTIELVTKYCAKLQLAQLGIARVFDALDDYEFARDVRAQLDDGNDEDPLADTACMAPNCKCKKFLGPPEAKPTVPCKRKGCTHPRNVHKNDVVE